MTVYKRGDSPYWVVEFVYQGERRRFSSGVTLKSEALEVETREKKRLKDEAIHGKRPEMTLADALERYGATVVKLNKREGQDTQREESAAQRLGAFFGPETVLSKITAARVSEFQRELLGDELAPASINRYTDMLKAILNQAAKKWGVAVAVPHIESLKVKNAKLRFLTADEEKRLLAVCPPHLHRFVVFLLGTGGRRGEALSLTWDDVDLTSNERAAVVFQNTKSDKPRRVPLPNHVRDLLAEMKAGAPKGEKRVFLYVPPGKDEETGEPHKSAPFDSVKRSFDTARDAAKLPDVTFHTLRHTYASRLVMKGVSIYVVSKLLGHSKIQMTMRYAHLAPEGLEAAVAALDAA